MSHPHDLEQPPAPCSWLSPQKPRFHTPANIAGLIDTGNITCTICMEPLTDVVHALQTGGHTSHPLLQDLDITHLCADAITLPCGHTFGLPCITTWILNGIGMPARRSPKCPMCRTTIHCLRCHDPLISPLHTPLSLLRPASQVQAQPQPQPQPHPQPPTTNPSTTAQTPLPRIHNPPTNISPVALYDHEQARLLAIFSAPQQHHEPGNPPATTNTITISPSRHRAYLTAARYVRAIATLRARAAGAPIWHANAFARDLIERRFEGVLRRATERVLLRRGVVANGAVEVEAEVFVRCVCAVGVGEDEGRVTGERVEAYGVLGGFVRMVVGSVWEGERRRAGGVLF